MHDRSTFSLYLELIKPRIMTMVLVTTTIGFFLGGEGLHSYWLLVFTLMGTGLSSSGAAVLNHYLEREVDCRMERTKNRPLPTGAVSPHSAFVFGIVLVLFGAVVLFSLVNLLTAYLNLLAVFLYVIVYTPLKRITWFNTFIGAIPGAIPPMAGWAAATGRLGIGAWVLFLILFTWQHPHFYAIAWIYKDDYRRGGMKMLPVVDETGKRTIRQILIYSCLLIIFSSLLTYIDATGFIYFFGALAVGVLMLMAGLALAQSQSVADARKLLRASIVYLPLLLVLIVIDSGCASPQLPKYSQVTEFHLTDSRGRDFSLAELKGKIWVADFIFTSCPGQCTLMTRELHKIYRSYDLEDAVRFVSFSVDPERDTPEVLAAYARSHEINTNKWHFLRGPIERIKKISVEGFKIGVMEDTLIHSERFVLVDRTGQVRGYYDFDDQSHIKRLFQDIALLLREDS